MKCLAASVAVVASLLGGCADRPRPAATAGQGELVLVCELNKGVAEAAIVPAANDLSRLPGVLEVTAVGRMAGNVVEPGKVTTAAGERVGFVVTFKTDAGPGQAAAGWLKALTDGGYIDKLARVTAYDGTARNYLIAEAYTVETTAADLERRSAAIKQQNELRGRTK